VSSSLYSVKKMLSRVFRHERNKFDAKCGHFLAILIFEKVKKTRFRHDKLRIKSSVTNVYINFSHISVPAKLNKYNGIDEY
jgi:hypothetical protein